MEKDKKITKKTISKKKPVEKKESKKKTIDTRVLILEKMKIDKDISEILIELCNEFNIPKKWFYIVVGILSGIYFYFKKIRNRKEKEINVKK